MRLLYKIVVFLVLCSLVKCARKMPTVGISVLVRNKAHILPHFFAGLMNQHYPKDRLYIRIYTDNNIDKSTEVVKTWANKFGKLYNNVFIITNETSLTADESTPAVWTAQRYEHVIKLREEALKFALNYWCDYMLMIDADVILTNENTLRSLVSRNKTVIAPMLTSEARYSNFWGGMSEDLYYLRTDLYDSILTREKTGCFEVPMVHSAVLVSLMDEAADSLAYDPKRIPGYDGPHDDIIAFATSAKVNQIPMHVCNDDFYGYITTPLEDDQDIEADFERLTNLKVDAIANDSPLPLVPELHKFLPPPPNASKFGCSEIFMINLKRREERRVLMELSFKELGMEVHRVEAVDGSELTPEDIKDIHFMEEYSDPYHDRKMKMGEVGCFLSHYKIWHEIVSRELEISMVLEDDVRFGPSFRRRLGAMLEELKTLDWDFVYLGRKRMWPSDLEERVTEQLVRPGYSYWTIGYLISLQGARKLIDGNPLTNLLPVDEYIPIMFNRHFRAEWKKNFPERGLKAFAADRELLQPAVYLHQWGYVSDTEDSGIVGTNVSSVKNTEDSSVKNTEDLSVNNTEHLSVKNTEYSSVKYTEDSSIKNTEDSSVKHTEDSIKALNTKEEERINDIEGSCAVDAKDSCNLIENDVEKPV